MNEESKFNWFFRDLCEASFRGSRLLVPYTLTESDLTQVAKHVNGAADHPQDELYKLLTVREVVYAVDVVRYSYTDNSKRGKFFIFPVIILGVTPKPLDVLGSHLWDVMARLWSRSGVPRQLFMSFLPDQNTFVTEIIMRYFNTTLIGAVLGRVCPDAWVVNPYRPKKSHQMFSVEVSMNFRVSLKEVRRLVRTYPQFLPEEGADV